MAIALVPSPSDLLPDHARLLLSLRLVYGPTARCQIVSYWKTACFPRQGRIGYLVGSPFNSQDRIAEQGSLFNGCLLGVDGRCEGADLKPDIKVNRGSIWIRSTCCDRSHQGVRTDAAVSRPQVGGLAVGQLASMPI